MTDLANYKLFTPLTLGPGLTLKNRIIMGPLTRARSDKVTHETIAINEEYYERRAGAGLIISEAAAISQQGYGWYGAPAMYNDAHVAAWKRVVDRVHAKGGKIFLQLWHMGRQAHSSFNPKHEIVSASAVRLEHGRLRNAQGEYTEYETPRALETHEVAEIVEDYRRAAERAKQAGFDGVEIHSANGYLVDQFLQSTTNHRTDRYGGSIENRARFLLEIVDALKTVWPAHRIGARLAPNHAFAAMGSPDNFDQFIYTMRRLRDLGIGYITLLDGRGFGYHDKDRLVTAFDAKQAFQGVVIANNSYTRDTAEGVVRSGAADAVGFGRLFIANPDLAERFQHDWPLNERAPYDHYWNPTLGADGYLTYESYDVVLKKQQQKQAEGQDKSEEVAP
ncbi:hypothetical protein P43SY_000310 [Pythium insidiosum]|uniref:NADH:flavin oxidoreductase/NADH oxidase N-terminal domain-containing protein n=1 Tax=Pythium insidiosum TaxID=114742 RepID=A0AAD5LJ49_PYTIN|nr:hypothetical protein P43SY_000310 [Pythium insidiosum]